jgi:hypothetical protein
LADDGLTPGLRVNNPDATMLEYLFLALRMQFCHDSDSDDDDDDDDGKVRHVPRVQFDGRIEVELSGET